jgi:nanoRNase/pAp phosphatase (c-di-AMP/oligoRNAs hydrolase)
MDRIAAVQVIDEEAPSTTEIVYALIKGAGVEIPGNIAQAIVTGIVAESGNLSRLRRSSLFNLCELSRKGGDVELVLRELRSHPALDERMARLRCAQRLVLTRVDDTLISISHVGSYHASAARGLLALGADLAATVSKEKEGLKITVRATEDYVRRTGIHVGNDICMPLGEILGGEGSGHAGVGGVRASGDVSQVKAKVLSFIEGRTAYALQGSER